MASYENILQMMREQGSVNNPKGIQLATMTGPRTCKIGDFPLTAEDLYIPDRLLSSVAVKVAGHCPADGALSDASSYSSALKNGDIVAICQISSTKYVILERVVSA
jgi:hypothetical protein